MPYQDPLIVSLLDFNFKYLRIIFMLVYFTKEVEFWGKRWWSSWGVIFLFSNSVPPSPIAIATENECESWVRTLMQSLLRNTQATGPPVITKATSISETTNHPQIWSQNIPVGNLGKTGLWYHACKRHFNAYWEVTTWLIVRLCDYAPRWHWSFLTWSTIRLPRANTNT